MDLRYYLPRADLRDYVRAYYYFATDDASVQPLCAELGNIRVVLNGAGELVMPGGETTPITSAFLIGPTMGAYTMTARAGTRVFGVGVRPRGWGALLGLNAQEAADCVFDLAAFAGGAASVSIDEIRNAKNLRDMAAAADRFFADLLLRRETKACRYPQAMEHWLLNPGELDLDRLLDAMDLSRRQTDRLAKQFFGASPKLLQRKYRALRAADRIRAGEIDWLAAAGEAFYDQSHFIKEFKTFVGVTPGQFIQKQAQLISEVQEKRRLEAAPLPLASF